MSAIQTAGPFKRQKELGSTSVFAAMSHAQASGKVLSHIGVLFLVAFTIDFVPRTLTTDFFVIDDFETTTLSHKTFNDAMENRVGISSFFDQVNKVAYSPRCFVFKQLKHNVALGCDEFDTRKVSREGFFLTYQQFVKHFACTNWNSIRFRSDGEILRIDSLLNQ